VGHTLRSSGLVRMEASRDRIFQFASRLMKARRRMVHRGGYVESKLKTDRLMRRAASDPATLALPFSFY
jgi:hypothetical protein